MGGSETSLPSLWPTDSISLFKGTSERCGCFGWRVDEVTDVGKGDGFFIASGCACRRVIGGQVLSVGGLSYPPGMHKRYETHLAGINSSSPRGTAGSICHERPNLSCSQPHCISLQLSDNF